MKRKIHSPDAPPSPPSPEAQSKKKSSGALRSYENCQLPRARDIYMMLLPHPHICILPSSIVPSPYSSYTGSRHWKCHFRHGWLLRRHLANFCWWRTLAKNAKSLAGARQRLCGLTSDLVIFSTAAHSGEKKR